MRYFLKQSILVIQRVYYSRSFGQNTKRACWNCKFHTALQGDLEKLKHNSAASAGVHNELTFLEQRHREVVNQIDTLKRDLVVKYLENEVHLPQEGEKIKAGPEQEGRYTNI